MPFGGVSLVSAIVYVRISHMEASIAVQLTLKMLTLCAVWHNNLPEASLVGGFGGDMTA